MLRSFCNTVVAVPLKNTAFKFAIPFASNNRQYHYTKISLGLEEFIEIKKSSSDSVTNGRAWTPADLRKKNFEDLHKLWYVLYKERNLLLTEREKMRRNSKPINVPEENRYRNVKRSMACIKFVINERKTIEKLIENESKTQEA